MARMPGAVWRPVARYQPGGSVCRRSPGQRRVIHHTAVSAAKSLYNYFSVAGRATSHFYIAVDGTIEQYIDTEYQSTANLNGNHDCITVESQDMGAGFPSWSGSDVPAWTAAQVDALARIDAWAHKVHGIPLVALPSSKPGTTGIGYHRQGIDPWRVSGGEVWSKASGKVCPGNRRVAQQSQIIARAVALAGGITAPTPEEWFDMFKDKSELADFLVDVLTGTAKTGTEYRAAHKGLAASGVAQALDGTQVPAQLRKAILVDTVVKRGVDASGNPVEVPLVQEIADTKTGMIAQSAEVAGLRAAVSALAQGNGVDPGAILDAVEAGVASALARVQVVVEPTA